MKSNLSHTDRAAINRQNAKSSTGPKTAEGKQRSSRNAFKHGLYSKALILPFEDPAEFHELRNALVAEHQPAGATEILLVDEIAQSAWRIRRFRLLEQQTLAAHDLDLILLSLFQRALASAERAFHRALTALAKLRKDSGFVSARPESRFGEMSEAVGEVSEAMGEMSEAIEANGLATCPQQNRAREQAAAPNGFVPQNPAEPDLTQIGAAREATRT